jgi:hypothetical protein
MSPVKIKQLIISGEIYAGVIYARHEILTAVAVKIIVL